MFRCALAGVLVFLIAASGSGQQSTAGSAGAAAKSPSIPQLSPSEAYRYATQPFFEARNSPNDLTEADQWALGQAIVRAQQQCEALKKITNQPPPRDPSAPAMQVPADKTLANPIRVPKEFAANVLALGRLCTFGQDLEPAREALIEYLGFSKTEDAKSAYLLLARVFVGLKDYSAAESQMYSIVNLFPYDGETHLAIDQTIDAAQAGGNTEAIARLDDLQLPYTLKALSDGGVIKGQENQIDAATLVSDALRCAAAMRASGNTKDASALASHIEELASAPAIAQTASKPEIDTALARYAMVEQPIRHVYGTELHGDLILKTGRTIPAARHLTGRSTVLVAVSLGAPASADVLSKLLTGLRQAHIEKIPQIVAITSYAATSGADQKSEVVLKALGAFAASLPPDISLLLVPDATIHALAIDEYPAGVVINSAGQITFLNLISGSSGSIQQLVQAALSTQAAHSAFTRKAAKGEGNLSPGR
jgi:hypothetical protein